MNIYDFNTNQAEYYSWNSKTESYVKRRAIIRNIQLLLLAMLTVSIILGQYLEEGQVWPALPIVAIILGIEMLALSFVTMVLSLRFSREDGAAWHDLYYRRYVKSNNRWLYLLPMAQACVDMGKMEEAQQLMTRYHSLQRNRKQRRWDTQPETVTYENSETVMPLPSGLSELKKRFRRICITNFVLLLYLIFTLVTCIVYIEFPSGYGYRSWFGNLSVGIIGVGGVIFLMYGLWLVVYYLGRIFKKVWVKVISTLIATVLSLVILAGGLLLGFAFLMNISHEEMQEDGTLLVTIENFLDPSICEIYEPVNLFVRKYSRSLESDMESQDDRDVNESQILPQDDSENQDISAEDNTQTDTLPDTDQYGVYSGDLELEQQYLALFDAIYNTNDGDKITFSYSAKGGLYAIIEDSDDSGTRERLVYDRESENGAYLLFVRYKDVMDDTGMNPSDTSIVNFYGYNPASGDIVAANKTSWSASSSQNYQKATGEN